MPRGVQEGAVEHMPASQRRPPLRVGQPNWFRLGRPDVKTSENDGGEPRLLPILSQSEDLCGGGQIGVLRPPPDTGEGDVDQMVVAAQNFFKVSAVRT